MDHPVSAQLEILRPINGLNFVTHLIYDKGSVVPEHFHDALELIYLFEGEGLSVTEGQAQIARADELLLINPNVPHRTSGLYGNINLLLQFPSPLLQQLIDDALQRELRIPPVPERSAAQQQAWQQLQRAAHALRETLEAPTRLRNLHISLYALQILEVLYAQFSQPRKLNLAKQRNLERLKPVLEYIEQHYAEPLSVSDAAAVLSLQPEYFCRFFKKNTGTTFLEYVNTLRLSHIYADLLNTDTPIMLLTETHGFTNYKLFNRMFRAQFKATPREIRARVRSPQGEHWTGIVHLNAQPTDL